MPGELIPIVLFIMAGFTVVFYPLAKAIAKRVEQKGEQEVPKQVRERLERMEHAIDAIAEQVERVAEGQRFTTKLLSERASAQHAELPGGKS